MAGAGLAGHGDIAGDALVHRDAPADHVLAADAGVHLELQHLGVLVHQADGRGSGAKDAQLLKFTREGKFLQQFGNLRDSGESRPDYVMEPSGAGATVSVAAHRETLATWQIVATMENRVGQFATAWPTRSNSPRQ